MADLKAMHATKLKSILTDAEAVSGTMLKIVHEINQVLDQGGVIHIQPQIAFLTGSLARMNKDWGVIEHLQLQGVSQQRKMKMR